MKKCILSLLLIAISTVSFSQNCYFQSIYGMFTYDNANPKFSGTGRNDITTIAAGDSVYFIVHFMYSTCSNPSMGFYLNGSKYADITLAEAKQNRICAIGYSPCDHEYGEGDFKIGYRFPLATPLGLKTWSIEPSPSGVELYITITAAAPTGIMDALKAGKEGSVSIYDVNGILVKESKVSNYTEGLQSGKLYLYRVVYTDFSTGSGKFMVE